MKKVVRVHPDHLNCTPEISVSAETYVALLSAVR